MAAITMTKPSTIYSVASYEAPAAGLVAHSSAELFAEIRSGFKQNKFMGGPIADLWTISNPKKVCEDSEFAEFAGIIGAPVEIILVRKDVFNAGGWLRDFICEPAEFAPFTFEDVEFVMFNCLRFVELDPSKKGVRPNFKPVLHRKNLPESGFFRVNTIGFYPMLFLAEPSEGGFKKLFDTSGMMGLTFEILGEENVLES